MTWVIAYAVSGSVHISTGITVLEAIGKTILYYFFDLTWDEFRRKL